MAQKKYECVVALGEYQDGSGQTKTRWQNVGAVIQTDKGFMMLLDRTFNPAGMPNPENRTNIVINLFEPQQRDQQGNGRQSQQSSQQYRQASQGGQGREPGFDDDFDPDGPPF